jgi:Ca-activated chloride channel family protein
VAGASYHQTNFIHFKSSFMQRSRAQHKVLTFLIVLGGICFCALVYGYIDYQRTANIRYPVADGGQKPPPNGNLIPAAHRDPSKLINWYAKAGNAYAIRNTAGDIYLYINIQSGQPDSSQRRIPLNVSLVLDRSGSMMGDKIAYARRAAKFLVDQLSKDDYLSIVNYDDQVEVTSPSQAVKNKEALKQALDRIYDRGATNLSGGMLEGFSQVKTTRKEGYVNRVLLLTDGLANEGIVEPAALKRLVEKKYKEEGIALSTFGLGADYNEDLLTMLAETGRANYYFIDSADNIPQLFAKELKGLLSVVAQNAMVQITLPAGIQCEKVYGYPYDIKNGQVQVRFNDINASDEKAVLLKLHSSAPLQSGLDLECLLTYTDAQSFTQAKEDRQVHVELTSDAAVYEKAQDTTVQELLALFEATEDFDKVMYAVDEREYRKAKDQGNSAINVLKEKQKKYNSPKLEEQIRKMSDYLQSLDSVEKVTESERKMFQKSSKAMNYEVKKLKKPI